MKGKRFLNMFSLGLTLLGMVAFIGACDSSSSSSPQNSIELLGAASIGSLEGTLLDNLEKSVNVHNEDLSKLNPGEPIIVAASSVEQLTSAQEEALLNWVDEYNPVILMQPNESQLRAFQEIFGTDRTGGWAHVRDGDTHLEAFSLSLGSDVSTYVGTHHPHVGANDDEAIQDERADKLIDWVYYQVPMRRAEKETPSSSQDEIVMPMSVSTSLPYIVHNSSGSYQVTAQGAEDWNYGGNTSVNVVLNMYPVFDNDTSAFWLPVAMQPELRGQDFSSLSSYSKNSNPAVANMYTFSSTLNGAIMDKNSPATTGQSETFTSGFSWNIGFSGTAKGGVSFKAGATWSNSTSKTISSVAIENQGGEGNQEVQFLLNGCQTSAQLSTFTTGPSTLWNAQNQSEGNEISYNFNLQVQFFPLDPLNLGTSPDPNLDNSCQTEYCDVIEGAFPCTATVTPLNSSYTIKVPKRGFLGL